MKEVFGSGDVFYTADGPLGIRVWLVLPGGALEELTGSVRKAHDRRPHADEDWPEVAKVPQ